MESDNIWEQMAHRYDTEDRAQTAKIITEAIRAELFDTKEKTALDYGCGTGLVGFGLVDLFKSFLFVDASEQMLEQVRQKLRGHQIGSAGTLCCDFLNEVPSGLTADYIIMSQVLLHIRDSRLILARLYDVLNTGGHLIVVDFVKNEAIHSDRVHNGFSLEALTGLMGRIGFASADAHTFYHGKGLFMNQDASLFILNAVKSA